MIGFANTSAGLFSARAVLISPPFQCVHCDSKNELNEKPRLDWQVKKIDLTVLQSKNPHH